MTEEKKFVPTWKVYAPSDLRKKWFIYYRKDGKRCARTYGTLSSIDDYNLRMEEAERMIAEKTGIIKASKNLSEQLYKYLYDHRGIWRNKTYQTYKSKVKVFLNWLGPRKLDSLAINDFFIELSQKRHRTTYNTYRRTLKKILPAIGYNGLLENIHKLKTSTTPAKYFQRHQAKRLKTYLKDNDPELLFFCEFVYYCFLRPNSELRLLKVGDVDLDRWCIRVPGKVSKNWKNQYVTIPLPFREKVKEELFYKHSSEWLFPGRFDQSKPIGTNSMMGRHRKVLRQLGFGKEYKLYSWKHTGAVACVQAGINIKQLQIQLRHENLETVDKYLRQLGIHDLHDLERLFPPI